MALNIKSGEKIMESCVMYFCPAYEFLVSLSNNGELKGPLKCPQIFCDRMKNVNGLCIKCGKSKPVHKGYYSDNAFTCFECNQNIPEKHIEIKEATPEETDIAIQKLDDIAKELKEKSHNSNFMKHYSDMNEKSQRISFYNPMNNTDTPLMWSYEYIKNTSMETLKEELYKFFDTFFSSTKENKCGDCKYTNNFQHLNCIDCSRNTTSVSILKKDRYKQ